MKRFLMKLLIAGILLFPAYGHTAAVQQGQGTAASVEPAPFMPDGHHFLSSMVSLAETHLKNLAGLLESLAMTDEVVSGD